MVDSVGAVGSSSGGDDKQAKKAQHQKEKQAFIQQKVQSGETQAQAEAEWKAAHPHHKKDNSSTSASSATSSSSSTGQMDPNSTTTPPSGSIFS
jgi:hypothetical protein